MCVWRGVSPGLRAVVLPAALVALPQLVAFPLADPQGLRLRVPLAGQVGTWRPAGLGFWEEGPQVPSLGSRWAGWVFYGVWGRPAAAVSVKCQGAKWV